MIIEKQFPEIVRLLRRRGTLVWAVSFRGKAHAAPRWGLTGGWEDAGVVSLLLPESLEAPVCPPVPLPLSRHFGQGFPVTNGRAWVLLNASVVKPSLEKPMGEHDFGPVFPRENRLKL